MRLLIFLALLTGGSAWAQCGKLAKNPVTGKMDCVGAVSSVVGVSGSNVTIGTTTLDPVNGIFTPDFALLEGVPGSNPPTNYQTLFFDPTTHLLRRLNSSGAISDVGGGPVSPAGSIISMNLNNGAGTSIGYYPGNLAGGGNQACASNKPSLWPIGGWLRNVTVTLSTTNGNTPIRGGYSLDCSAPSTTTQLRGGTIIMPGAAAGAYVNAYASESWHVSQGGNLALGTSKLQSGGTGGNVTNVSAEFIADSGVWTVLAASLGAGAAFTASANNFPGPWGGNLNGPPTELARAIPIPVAGTVQYFTYCSDTGVPTNDTVATIRVNGTPSAITFTAAAGSAAASCWADVTHTAAVTAGQYVSTNFATGASTQMVPNTFAWGFKPSTGSTVILGGMINGTVTTTATYNSPLGTTTDTNVANASMGLPRACTMSKLYVMQATANGAGVTTTFTLQKNGADTAITGTINQASGTGAIAVDTTHSVSYAKGDLLSIKYVTGSGTSGTMGAWSVACD